MSDERANEPILGDERNTIGAGQEEHSRTPGGLATTAFGLSDIGCQRSVNQDTLGNRIGQFTAQASELGLLYAIADGMGGHARGEVASALAIHELFARYYGSSSAQEARQALARVMIETNAAVYQAGREAGGGTMGTTLTLVLLRDNILYVGNIGDSRTYLVRGGKIKQLSHDHSLIGEQVRSGVLTEAQARTSSIRNVITRAVGYREAVEPDTFAFTVQVGDILLLCSDGLHGLIEDDELAQLLNTRSLADATTALIALARERGGPDNITALVVRIDQIGAAPLAAGDDQTTESFSTLDDDTTRPLPMIPPGQTDEIIADPADWEAADADAATKPNPLIGVGAAVTPAAVPPPAPPPPPAAAPASIAPVPPITAAPRAAPPPERQARPPIWLFIAIPLLLIALVAAGAFFFVKRSSDSTPATTVPSASPAALIVTTVATTVPVAGAVPSIAPTPAATVTTTLSTPPPALTAQAPLPTAASGPAGLPVLPPGAPSATADGGTQRALVSGTIRIAEGVVRPENFPTSWVVVVYDQAEWQRQRRLAEPKGQAPINSFPLGAEYTFRIDLELPAESQTERLFVLQVQQQGASRTATIETVELRVGPRNRTTLAPVVLRITGFSEESEPGPAQTPRPGGYIGVVEGMIATRVRANC